MEGRMKTAQKPWIKLKETLDREDCLLIGGLEKECLERDGTAFKLELAYKLASAAQRGPGAIKTINSLMYFDGYKLIGYLGVDCFGGHGAPPEANGMVHPDYRGQEVFTALHGLMAGELKRRGTPAVLLLCDRKSSAGQRFVRKTGAQKHHAEFEMYLRREQPLAGWPDAGITFRRAENGDAGEIARQNAVYFGKEEDADVPLLPEEEAKRGITIYLACLGDEIIGKTHLQLDGTLGGIYGLGVLPQYRGRGLGRAVLMGSVGLLQKAGAKEIMLQVATENERALHLYESCGFQTTSTMDYYLLYLER